MRFVLILMVSGLCGMVGCAPVASPSEVDANATTAKDNAMFNARKWRADAGDLYATWNLVPRGDSSITSSCVTGDGWGTIEMYSADQHDHLTLKCSTWSIGRGCTDKDHFKASPAATEDGTCQPTGAIPNPIPRIAQ